MTDMNCSAIIQAAHLYTLTNIVADEGTPQVRGSVCLRKAPYALVYLPITRTPRSDVTRLIHGDTGIAARLALSTDLAAFLG